MATQAATKYQNFFTAADMVLYSAKEGMGWGRAPHSGDTIPSGAAYIYQEWVEECTTATMRDIVDVNEYSGLAADETDSIMITHRSDTTVRMNFRSVGLCAEALGSIMGAGASTAPAAASGSAAANDGIISPGGLSTALGVTTSSKGVFAHQMSVATAFNRTGTHHFWYDTGDHNNRMELAAQTPKSWRLSFSPTTLILCEMGFEGLAELAKYDTGSYNPINQTGLTIRKVSQAKGFVDNPYPSSLCRFSITGPSGKPYPSFTVESGDITLERTLEPLYGNSSTSAHILGQPSTHSSADVAAITTSLVTTGPQNPYETGAQPIGFQILAQQPTGFTDIDISGGNVAFYGPDPTQNLTPGTVYSYTFTNVSSDGVESILSNAKNVTATGAVGVQLTLTNTMLQNSINAGSQTVNIYRSTVADPTGAYWIGSFDPTASSGIVFDYVGDTQVGLPFAAANPASQGTVAQASQPRDINSSALHITGNFVCEYSGMAANSMWQDYRDYSSNGAAPNGIQTQPQIIWFQKGVDASGNPAGNGLRLAFWPVKWDTFNLDRSGTRVKAQVAFRVLADRSMLLGSGVNSKMAAVVYNPNNKLLIY